MTKRCCALDSVVMRSICRCSFSTGPRLPDLVSSPINSSMLVSSSAASRGMRDRHPALAVLVGGHGLLRDAELFGELHLGNALVLTQLVDACSQLDEKGTFVAGDGDSSGG